CSKGESCITEVPDEVLKRHHRELNELTQDESFRDSTRPDVKSKTVQQRLLVASTIIAMDYLITEMKRRGIW
ncbi:MAG: hypothetical protein AAFU78_14945, partial [Cyanobacteria bacterium J06633_2]